MGEGNVILKVEGVKRYFPVRKGFLFPKILGYVKAADDISFELREGEALGVVGESGCGKTTLGKLIIGLDDPTEGRVTFMGRQMGTRMKREERQKLQMVFQDPYSSLDPRMKVRRIIEEPLRIHTHLTPEEKLRIVKPLLELVGLREDALEKYPHEFSGGQRQRIGIARALALEPKLLVCDEPVSALDVSIQAQVLNLFKELQKKKNLAYVFISHDMSVIRHVSDRIMVMYLGQVMESAPKRELFEHTMHPYSAALMDAIPVPDPKYKRRRKPLSGDIPSPIDAPRGCPFQTRCPKAMDCCRESRPKLHEAAPEHFVACHLFDQTCKKAVNL
ncbi:MAG: ATP-binding cassette domain-containing protein [Hungatella sp.]|nr:ATP-binding cassette domain-containing protein [Hungatella sp.]